jgi:hypothetical protein
VQGPNNSTRRAPPADHSPTAPDGPRKPRGPTPHLTIPAPYVPPPPPATAAPPAACHSSPLAPRAGARGTPEWRGGSWSCCSWARWRSRRSAAAIVSGGSACRGRGPPRARRPAALNGGACRRRRGPRLARREADRLERRVVHARGEGAVRCRLRRRRRRAPCAHDSSLRALPLPTSAQNHTRGPVKRWWVALEANERACLRRAAPRRLTGSRRAAPPQDRDAVVEPARLPVPRLHDHRGGGPHDRARQAQRERAAACSTSGSGSSPRRWRGRRSPGAQALAPPSRPLPPADRALDGHRLQDRPEQARPDPNQLRRRHRVRGPRRRRCLAAVSWRAAAQSSSGSSPLCRRQALSPLACLPAGAAQTR